MLTSPRSPPQMTSTIAAGILLVSALTGFVALGLLWNSRQARYRSLPPSVPSGIFGTSFPELYPWRTFEKWTHTYGEVITIWLGWSPLVVVGSYAAAMQLLEKSSALTSDRPLSVMAGYTMSGDKRILLVKYGERWRRLRKMLHQGLQPKMAASFEPIQERAAWVLVNDIKADPSAFAAHAGKYAASVVLSITYGKSSPTEYTDPVVEKVNICLNRLGASLRPGAWLVDSFPFLRYFPGAWKKTGEKWHEEELQLFRSQMDEVRSSLRSGDAPDSVGKFMIEHQKEYSLSDNEIDYLGGSMFGAGSDTTASAITVAIMAAAVFPHAARRAQEELDLVVGRERAPTFSDQEDLPYLKAFVNEVFRWRPVSSGGFAHMTTADILYKGYVIPRGTAIVGNHWSISRDPDVFPDPDEFRPERWLIEGKSEKGLRKDINHVGYGFGRRVCAGKNVADRSLYINCALLLWAFTIERKRKAGSDFVNIDTFAFTNTANSHPLPFKVDIQPRFTGMSEIMSNLLS